MLRFLVFSIAAFLPLITAQNRIVAGRLMEIAHARLLLTRSEAAGGARMRKEEITRQWCGDHHVWLDAAIAEGPHVCAQLGYALLEHAGEIDRVEELQRAAATRKRMASMDMAGADARREEA